MSGILTLADFDNAALFAEIERRRTLNDHRVPTPRAKKTTRNAATAKAVKAAPKADPLARARVDAAEAFIARIVTNHRKEYARAVYDATVMGNPMPTLALKFHGDAEFMLKAQKRIAYYFSAKFTPAK